MRDSVRITVETDAEERAVNVHDDEGAVSVGDATFRFDVSGIRGGVDADADANASTDGDESTAGVDPRFIAPLDDVPADGTLRFEALAGRRGVEGILQRDGDAAFAWENSCPHEPEIRLDEGTGAPVADDQFVCHKHGARFNCDDGFCTRGPCRGSALASISVDVRDDGVYLTDDRFDACHRLDAW